MANNRYNSGPNNKRNDSSSQFRPPEEIKALQIPEAYVDQAECVMRNCSSQITTSKLRNLLSLAVESFNREQRRTEAELLPESAADVQFMRIRIAYECGRDEKTKRFVQAAKLLEYAKGICSSRDALLNYYHYMEALVAYHRYFGGREN